MIHQKTILRKAIHYGRKKSWDYFFLNFIYQRNDFKENMNDSSKNDFKESNSLWTKEELGLFFLEFYFKFFYDVRESN